MHVIGRNDRHTGLFCERNQSFVDLFLLLKMVIHQFDIEVFFSEDIKIFVKHFFSGFHTEVADSAVDLYRKAGARRDQNLGVSRGKCVVRSGLIVKSAGMRIGNDMTEIMIADIILCKQDQMIAFDV